MSLYEKQSPIDEIEGNTFRIEGVVTDWQMDYAERSDKFIDLLDDIRSQNQELASILKGIELFLVLAVLALGVLVWHFVFK